MDLHRPSISHILLTGAGFTHNFGGPLAEGMWSLIFNHPDIRSTEHVHALLRNNFDFEDAYHEVMDGDGDYTDEERSAIHKATLDAYENIDAIVRGWVSTSDSPHRINRNKIIELIALFAGNKHECGFFFTLNQDLFVERNYSASLSPAPLTPGIRSPTNVNRFSLTFHEPIDRTNKCTLPKEEEAEENADTDLRSAHFCYVKLHGSHDWQRHDGSSQLVIGGGKEEIISREPILRWNKELFKSVLRQRDRRLLVIGYGFRDSHVNQEIVRAITEHGLRLIILCPVSPKEFQERLTVADLKHGNAIWQGLEGYFPYTLEELFPLGETKRTKIAGSLYEAVMG